MKIEFSSLKDLLTFNIKYYRYLNNYSQEKLAELSSLSSRYITDVEDLIEPNWLIKKFGVLNEIDKEMVKRDIYQGDKYKRMD